MNNNLTVSIIVPVYNAENYLSRCLDSIIHQSFKDFELILVDDGSKDKSGEICDNYATTDSRIHVFHQQNGGVSLARNIGITHAIGEFIAFIDADDYVYPNYLEEFLRFSTCDMVIGGYITNPTRKRITISNHCYKKEHISQFLLSHIHRLYFTVPWGKLYKRNIIHNYHILFDSNIRLAEDLIFNLQYLEVCHTIQTLDTCGYVYYQGTSLVDEKYNLKIEELEYVLKRCKEKYRILEDIYHVILSNHTFKTLTACYPINRVYELNDDKEYYNIYQKYTGEDNISSFYKDIVASPINKTIYSIVSLYLSGKKQKSFQMAKLMSQMYGSKIGQISHPSFFYRALYSTIKNKWFFLTKTLLAVYSIIKK